MKKYHLYQLCALLLTLFAFAFVYSPPCAIAENGTTLNENADGNRNINYTIDMDVIPGYKDTSRYLVGLHNRTDAYHPKSVLISGILFAQTGTEIKNAGVEVGNEWFPAQEVCRFFSQYIPESELKDMEVEVDKNRSAFAFLVDLSSANLQEGFVVKMEVSGVNLMFSECSITLDSNCWPYSDVVHALEGYVVKYGESNDSVRLLQQNLAVNEYLNEKEISGVYDETTRLAVNEFCKVNQVSDSETEKCADGVTQSVFKLVSSSLAIAKPKFGIKTILDALNNEVFTLGDFSVELWMIIAAGALLVAVILILILLTKKKSSDIPADIEPPIMENDLGTGNIVEMDESTVNLETPPPDDVYPPDEKTMELKIFTIMLRLFYNGMYADKSVILKEGEQAVIGRSSEAQLQTNPADKSVSGMHGVFSVKNGTVLYTDQSTNGTKVDETTNLGKNADKKTVNLPLNTRVTMEMGTHKLWVLVKE